MIRKLYARIRILNKLAGRFRCPCCNCISIIVHWRRIERPWDGLGDMIALCKKCKNAPHDKVRRVIYRPWYREQEAKADAEAIEAFMRLCDVGEETKFYNEG